MYAPQQPLSEGLSKATPWYSLALEEMIKKDVKNPVLSGSRLLDTFRNLRTLGSREYEMTDHLGNVLVTFLDRKTGYGAANGLYRGFSADVSSVNDYFPYGQLMNGRSLESSFYRSGYNGMHKDNEISGVGNSLDFGARMYDSRLGRWTALDPHAERYRSWSPYNFVFNNPLIFIDPDGRDPIYGKNFWGRAKLIGDDGKTHGKSYLVSGTVKRDVKSSTKAGEKYTGSLAENNNVFKIPTGGVMDDVISSVNDTENSQKENGGHANVGSSNATRWDEGVAAIPYTDEKGNQGAKASLTMFMIDGKDKTPRDASNIEFWWHTHPNTTINGLTLGGSVPSDGDLKGQQMMINRGYKGNTFVIGVRSGTVTFFNGKKPLITIKYSDFKTMGGK